MKKSVQVQRNLFFKAEPEEKLESGMFDEQVKEKWW